MSKPTYSYLCHAANGNSVTVEGTLDETSNTIKARAAAVLGRECVRVEDGVKSNRAGGKACEAAGIFPSQYDSWRLALKPTPLKIAAPTEKPPPVQQTAAQAPDTSHAIAAMIDKLTNERVLKALNRVAAVIEEIAAEIPDEQEPAADAAESR